MAHPSYYVTMIDYGRRGREAIVDPEITYSGVVGRVRSGEYRNILFIHHIDETGVEDVTEAVLYDAGKSAADEAADMRRFEEWFGPRTERAR